MISRITNKFTMNNAKWLWLALAVYMIDQIAKVCANKWLVLYQPVPIVPFLNLTLVHNTGAAFGILEHASGWQFWLFLFIAIIVSSVILMWLHRLTATEKRTALALMLILGGALGNLADRIMLGHVVDFIDFYVGEWHWYVFNLADVAICGGGLLLILDVVKRKSHEP